MTKYKGKGIQDYKISLQKHIGSWKTIEAMPSRY